MSTIKKCGTLWARNKNNLEHLLKTVRSGSTGVYVLFNGSAPVYVGKGHIRSRITSHARSTKRAFWDHFSWFVVNNKKREHDLEALLIVTLPFYLRIFTRQDAKFLGCKRLKEADPTASLRMPKSIARFHRPRRRSTKHR